MHALEWNANLRPALAYKWLNADTYWDTWVADPCDELPQKIVPTRSSLPRPVRDYPAALLRKYPLVDPAGQRRRSHLRDRDADHDLGRRTPPEMLAAQLVEAALARDEAGMRRKMALLEALRRDMAAGEPHVSPLQLAEVRLGFGLTHAFLGDHESALSTFEACVRAFRGSDRHAEAIARWLAGWTQLLQPARWLAQGLAHWSTAHGIFADFADDGTRRTREEQDWYRRRARLMLDHLQYATQFEGIHLAVFLPDGSYLLPAAPVAARPAPAAAKVESAPPAVAPPAPQEAPEPPPVAPTEPPLSTPHDGEPAAPAEPPPSTPPTVEPSAPSEPPPSTPPTGEPPAPSEPTPPTPPVDESPAPKTSDAIAGPGVSLAETWLRLAGIPVFQDPVKADPKGTGKPVGAEETRDIEHVEFNRFRIAGQAYRPFDIAGRLGYINLTRGSGYLFVRVEGTSMDGHEPVPVCPDDYVLVLVNPEPRANRVVVARFADPKTGETLVTVKRVKWENGVPLLVSESRSQPNLRPVSGNETHIEIIGEVIAVARRVGDGV